MKIHFELNFDKKTELIIADELLPDERLPKEPEFMRTTSKTSGPIFFTGCELLSVDYESLKNDLLMNLPQLSSSDKLAPILYKYHRLFAEPNFAESIFERYSVDKNLGDKFNSLVFLQTYADMLSKNEINAEVGLFSTCFSYATSLGINAHDGTIEEMGVISPEMPSLSQGAWRFYIKHVHEKNLATEYQIGNITGDETVLGICVFTIFYALKVGYPIKRCKNCQEFFVPVFRSDTKYCTRASPQDEKKTCQQYAKGPLWLEQLSAARKLERSVYMTKQTRARRYENEPEFLHAFQKFKEDSKLWKKKINEGEVTEEEYIAWLKIQRNTKP